jgi:hypothetical protein
MSNDINFPTKKELQKTLQKIKRRGEICHT